jgi:hypothetical protein
MNRSTVVGKEKFSKVRTSHNAFLEKAQDDVVRCIELRASRISKLPIGNIEPLQVVWYRDGQE